VECQKSYIHLRHTEELNDVLIAAVRIGSADPRYSLESFVHEWVLKRHPFKVAWQDHGHSQTFTAIPDAFLDFRFTLPDGAQRRMPVFLEHDRDTEKQQKFRQRIRAYIMLLKSEAYKERFATRVITVAFTTFAGAKHGEEMRTWARAELAASNEPWEVGATFTFAGLPKTLTATQAWLEPRGVYQYIAIRAACPVTPQSIQVSSVGCYTHDRE